MPSITRIENKKGVSFKIVVSTGTDENGKQIRHFKTWKPSKPMSEKNLMKAVNQVAFEFERDLKQGYQVDDRQTFKEYADYVYDLHAKRGSRPNTLSAMKWKTGKVLPHIGNMKIKDIRPQHLNKMINELMQGGQNKQHRLATAIVDIAELMHVRKRAPICRACGISTHVLERAIKGQNITIESAEKIAVYFGREFYELFKPVGNDKALKIETIKSILENTRAIFEQARKEMIIFYNPADLVTLPKTKKQKKPRAINADDLKAFFSAIKNESIETQTIFHLLIVTGCRRGELLALRWDNLDIKKREIIVNESIKYTKGYGVYTGETKTGNTRTIALSDETISLLMQYRQWQNDRRYIGMYSLIGWNENNLIFSQENGNPKSPNTINMLLTALTMRYNLPHLTPHMFRHTVASMLIYNGIDVVTVAEMLGHSNITTTLNTYSHAINEGKRKVAECVETAIIKNGIA